MSADVSELRALARDLSEAPRRVQREAAGVVEKGALNVKNGMRDDAEGIGHAPHFPRSITYDMKVGAALVGRIEAEIGPDKGLPQGALGNILYFGTSNNAPVRDIGKALAEEAPRFEKALADLAAEALP